MQESMYDTDLLDVLKKCDGYYESPKDGKGNYLGPLVAYAGKYDEEHGQKNYVGYVYFNFAKAEQDRKIRKIFVHYLAKQLAKNTYIPDIFLGAPMGGFMLATDLGSLYDCRTIFAEKKVIIAGNSNKNIKETSELIIDRHDIYSGEKVVIVEDVCNNFSTTKKLINLVYERGGEVVAITCAVNRSNKFNYNAKIPVISTIYAPTAQYKQSDKLVSFHIHTSNVVWNPKKEWWKLKKAMEINQ